MFTSTLSQAAQDALAILGASSTLDFAYLAGGSALALQFGHRQSYDFDFFAPNEFDSLLLSSQLKKLGKFIQTSIDPKTLLGTFNSIKFSCFYYPYNNIQPTTRLWNIHIAHIQDIAAMKLVAITDRGTKRDFIDLYEYIKKGFSLEDMFAWYDQKYHILSENIFTLLKALAYFDQAEYQQMPKMLTPVSWEEVKAFFTQESLRLGKKYLE